MQCPASLFIYSKVPDTTQVTDEDLDDQVLNSTEVVLVGGMGHNHDCMPSEYSFCTMKQKGMDEELTQIGKFCDSVHALTVWKNNQLQEYWGEQVRPARYYQILSLQVTDFKNVLKVSRKGKGSLGAYQDKSDLKSTMKLMAGIAAEETKQERSSPFVFSKFAGEVGEAPIGYEGEEGGFLPVVVVPTTD